MGGGNSYNSTIAYQFDPAPLRELIDKAVEIYGNLEEAVNEANRQAADCNQPKLSLREPLRY